ENSFSFSPVAGLMEASAIQLNKRTHSICHPERSRAESKDPVEIAQISAKGFLDFARNDGCALPTTVILSESKHDRASQNTIAREAQAQPQESLPRECSRYTF